MSAKKNGLPVRIARLECNNAGAWKSVIRLDFNDDSALAKIMTMAGELGRIGNQHGRVSFRLVVAIPGAADYVLNWSLAKGWDA